MKVNLNKRLLLFLAVFMVLVLIPTSFAADAADGDVVGISEDSAIDTISESAVSDDISSDNSDSAVSAINDDIISADGDEGDEGDEGDDVEPDDNIYVDASAAAGGNGSKDNPFQTVSQAYNNATDGKTIVINPGTYTIGTSNDRMTVNKNLTFTGVGEVKFKAANNNGYMQISQNANHVEFNNIQFVDSRFTTGTLFTTYHEMFYVAYSSANTEHDIIFNNCVIKNITASTLFNRQESWGRTDIVDVTVNGSILMNNTFNSNIFNDVTRGTVNNNFWGSNSKPTGLGNAVTINNWIVVRADITDEEKTIGNTYPVSLELKSYNGTEDSELEDNFQEFDLTLSAVVNAIEPNFVKISENKGGFDYVVAEGGAETISYVNGRNTVPLLTFTIPKVLFEIEKINEGEKLKLSIHASKSTSNVTVRVDDKDYVIPLTDGEAVEEIETNLVPGTYTVTVFIRNNPEASKVIEIDYRNVEFAFDITDTEINKQASIKIIPSIESFKEDIIVFVNDKKYTATKAEDYTIVTDPLAAGYYNVIALFYGDAYHNEASNTTSFNVAKLTTEIAITLPPSIKIGDDVEVAITSYDGADIKVTVNGEEKTLTDGKLTIPNVAAGTYVITATVDETAVQEGATKTESFNLFKDDASITASGTNAVAGEPSTITVTVTDASGAEITTGTVIVKVNEMEYGIDLSKGNTVQVIINAAGTYDVTAKFLGNDAYNAAETAQAAQIEITEPQKVDPVINIPTDIVAGEDATIEIDIPGATGNISVIVDGVETSIPLEDGKASITLDKLSSGDHSVVVLYDGDGNIAGVHTAAVISVPAADVGNKTKIDIPTDIKAGEDTPINIDIPGATGNVSVIVDGKETVIPLVDGKASYTLSNMSEGDHSFVLIYPGDGTIGPIHSATSFNVAPSENGTDNKTGARTNTTISSKALTISTYVKAVNGKNTRYFTVTLKDKAGKTLAGKTIQFVFNGKITKVTTDKNGKAKVLIGTATKGTYYMTASFLGDDDYNACVATQKVKINPQKTKIVAKKKTFKRSKKVKKYTVTLKAANGKAIKGKKIVLVINKKKYTKKTNKKGKAVFKLKKLSRKKTYKAKIKFAGDKYFKKSSKTAKIKVK